MVAAIRKHDPRHLITVGLVDWSLDRPGLTSGFVPQQVAEPLDFVAVHVYPETGQGHGGAGDGQGLLGVGKPVVIEETFPLKCSFDGDDAVPHRIARLGRRLDQLLLGADCRRVSAVRAAHDR